MARNNVGDRAALSSMPEFMRSARAFYEPQLQALGVGLADIDQQRLPELRSSLERINEAIAHPDQFGTLRLRLSGSGNRLVPVASTTGESQVEVGALPVLLERKRHILDRIQILAPDEQLSHLRTLLVEKVTDDDARAEIMQLLQDQAAEQKGLAEQAEQVDEAQDRAALLKVEIQERKYALYRSLIERESVATIVGALILIAVTVALLIAMFVDVAASNIVENAFLVILGYFFGQSISRSRTAATSGSAEERPAS
ncbi:hypothetical protein JQS43_20685 [Natronosporangium hydrolyticum]|uniref:Uncharacterized protein n=1 Tax=Natronosporangium hydrolyticum TaxID=2811111 RepID=A0A895Y8A5_9ACTN|nr:hypothetical protein [Natronosporangium hydrolyticum]QSB13937.1 hypothetical protein JQS43_20685 [Natronosporangium hydrolyticum]